MSKKAKLACTMYGTYDGYCDWVKPTNGKAGEDYEVIRKGSVFTVYSTPEEVKRISDELGIEDTYALICAHKNGGWFGYYEIVDFEESTIWEMITEGVKK